MIFKRHYVETSVYVICNLLKFQGKVEQKKYKHLYFSLAFKFLNQALLKLIPRLSKSRIEFSIHSLMSLLGWPHNELP